MTDPPHPIRLFHFTHIDNLADVVISGLRSDAEVRDVSPDFVEVGDFGIKARRRRRSIPAFGGYVGDCVPFYFAARSPMLYRLWDRGRGVEQPNIVYLVTTLDALIQSGHDWAASDRNAVLDIASFTSHADELGSLIDWPLMSATMWSDTPAEPDRKERRMAECLIRDQVAWDQIAEIGCQNAAAKDRVRGILDGGANHHPSVIVRPRWYF